MHFFKDLRMQMLTLLYFVTLYTYPQLVLHGHRICMNIRKYIIYEEVRKPVYRYVQIT